MLALTVSGPFFVLKPLGAALWVRLLFLPGTLFSFVFLSMGIISLVDTKDLDRIPGVYPEVAFGICITLFIAGCFCVRARAVRVTFWIQGGALIAVVGFYFLLAKLPRPVMYSAMARAIAVLYNIGPVALSILPLAVLYYRRWKGGIEHEQITAAVEALGA